MGWKGNKCTSSLFGISEGKNTAERPTHKLEDNIKMDLMDLGLEVVD
jgi:hypothetical protein